MDTEEADKSAYEKFVEMVHDETVAGSIRVPPSDEHAPIQLHELLQGWERTASKLAAIIRQDTGQELQINIDEVAIMFKNRRLLWRWVTEAVGSGNDITVFNSDFDRVHTWPHKTEYDVEYLFLDTDLSFRIEAMVKSSGCSPLHDAVAWKLNRTTSDFATVHFSFRCFDVDDYRKVMQLLKATDWELAQWCESSYGKFSYWASPDSTVFLKPRLNTRDAYIPKAAGLDA